MIKVNQYPQEFRLPTLPDEAKAPKSNPQPLDQYQETVPLLGDFGKFSSAETGNAILTNRIRLYQEGIANPSDEPGDPNCPAEPFCKETFSKSTTTVGPFSRDFTKTTDCPAPVEP